MSAPGRSQEIDRSGRIAQRAGTGIREGDSRPQSFNCSDRVEGTIRLLYHGRCSRCHHFHRHVAFDAQMDHTQHTRFHCERCDHPMFGLGRTDTQDSTPSQDSLITSDGVKSPSAAVSCLDNSRPPLSLQPNTPSHLPLGPDQLSAIPEQQALGRSRATSATQTLAPTNSRSVPPTEPRSILTGPSVIEIAPSPHDLDQVTRETKPRPTFVSYWCRKVVGKLARRIDNAPHEIRFLGLRLHYQLDSVHLIEHQSPSLAIALPLVDRVPTLNNAQESGQDEYEVMGTDAMSIEPVEERIASPSYGERDDLNADPARQAPTSTHLTSNRHTTLKAEPPSRERREKIEKTRALQRKCNDIGICDCKGKGVEPSVSDNSRHKQDEDMTCSATSRSHRCFPAYSLGDSVRQSSISSESNPFQIGARPDPLAHVGGFYFPRWRPTNTAKSTTSGDSSGRQRHNSAAASNTSSISLYPSRPVLPARSFSASLLPFTPPSSEFDFGARDIFRSLEFLHHARAIAVGSNFLPWRRSGSIPRISRYDQAIEPGEYWAETSPPLAHALSTNTVCHPMPQEE